MNDKIVTRKKEVRRKIKELKNTFSKKELDFFSEEVLSTLECTTVFEQASVVLAYYNLPDEVNTQILIDKYCTQKQFLLPVVYNDELVLKKYTTPDELQTSGFGISEPGGDVFLDFYQIDLVIVPGVAFDRNLNRMGRGKGFYDRLLPKISCPRIGYCFDFQIMDCIPTDVHDLKMNMIVAQNEIIIE